MDRKEEHTKSIDMARHIIAGDQVQRSVATSAVLSDGKNRVRACVCHVDDTIAIHGHARRRFERRQPLLCAVQSVPLLPQARRRPIAPAPHTHWK